MTARRCAHVYDDGSTCRCFVAGTADDAKYCVHHQSQAFFGHLGDYETPSKRASRLARTAAALDKARPQGLSLRE